MKDVEALAEAVRLELESWIERGHYSGDVKCGELQMDLGVEEDVVDIRFGVQIRLDLRIVPSSE